MKTTRLAALFVAPFLFAFALPRAFGLSATPQTFLTTNYAFQTSTAGGAITNVAASTDYICIPRTAISSNLTAAMCTNDMRAMLYFFLKKTHAVVDAQPSTNRFNKLTVSTGSFVGSVSNIVIQTLEQSFKLDASAIAPAGE